MYTYTYTDMGTKTISIMDDVYDLLKENKFEDESFSDELRRIITKKKSGSLNDFFGIISENEGKAILNDLKSIRKKNLELLKKRLQ
jgi:predicted CopG family antitoxin